MGVSTFFSKAKQENTVSAKVPIRVCMHVRGVARTDERVLREASTLVEAGFAVTIVDIDDDLNRPREQEINGIYLVHIFKPGWLLSTSSIWRRLIKSTQKLIYTTIRLLQIPADIYHAHDDNALLPCYLTAFLCRKLLIFDAHEMPLKDLDNVHWHIPRFLFKYLFAHIMRHCVGVITVSPPIAHTIHKKYLVPTVTLIRNLPVYKQIAKSDRLRQSLRLDAGIQIALYQGNIQADRGLNKLVLAAEYLKPEIVIVIMGKDVAPSVSELETLIAHKKVADRVKIIPPVPYTELLNWTASADIGLNVLPPDYSFSIRMCLPNKLFEYLMAGLPVLSSSLDAVAEVIKTYDVGRIVSSLAPEDIGMAINAMFADNIALARMRQNALEAARSDLCWEQERQNLLQLYNNILAAQNQPFEKSSERNGSNLEPVYKVEE